MGGIVSSTECQHVEFSSMCVAGLEHAHRWLLCLWHTGGSSCASGSEVPLCRTQEVV